MSSLLERIRAEESISNLKELYEAEAPRSKERRSLNQAIKVLEVVEMAQTLKAVEQERKLPKVELAADKQEKAEQEANKPKRVPGVVYNKDGTPRKRMGRPPSRMKDRRANSVTST